MQKEYKIICKTISVFQYKIQLLHFKNNKIISSLIYKFIREKERGRQTDRETDRKREAERDRDRKKVIQTSRPQTQLLW